MAIDAGRMTKRITFQRRKSKKGELGGRSNEWEDVKTIWAAITPLSAREIVTKVREVAVTHRILCRYTSGIDQRMQIKWGERTFRILSIIDYDERHRDMTIMAEELTDGRQF